MQTLLNIPINLFRHIKPKNGPVKIVVENVKISVYQGALGIAGDAAIESYINIEAFIAEANKAASIGSTSAAFGVKVMQKVIKTLTIFEKDLCFKICGPDDGVNAILTCSKKVPENMTFITMPRRMRPKAK